MANLITHKTEWSPLLRKDVKVEKKQEPKVETFGYMRLSEQVSANTHKAEIVAYDANHDLALLKLRPQPKSHPYVATILPKAQIDDVKLFMQVFVGGCSLAHEPFCSDGNITYTNETIEQKRYWMVNAPSIFGNSGGALYLGRKGVPEDMQGKMIGVPSRITAIMLGFGVDVMTWMGFSAHTSRIYEFMEEQQLNFLFDDTKSYQNCLDSREDKAKESLLEMKAEALKNGGK